MAVLGYASAGCFFLDRRGRPVGMAARDCVAIKQIELARLHPGLKRVEILVACDVDNPLIGHERCGVSGRKGATSAMSATG